MYLRLGETSTLLVAALCLATTCTAYKDFVEKESAERVPRSLGASSSFPSPGRGRAEPVPSPTFPNPPPRFRLQAEISEEPIDRHVRSVQPHKNTRPWPTLSPTIPRPEDIHRPVLARFRREGGRVSVDVEKNRGSKSTTRVTAEQNVYRSGDGRTRVDASAYATNRGDRGGSINFSHRF